MKHIIYIIALFCLPFALQAQTAAAATAVDAWNQAISRFKAKDFKQAKILFQQLNEVEYGSSEAQSYLADCYYNLQEIDSAVVHYESALLNMEAPHKIRRCRAQIVRCYLQKQDFERAYDLAMQNVQTYANSEYFRQELQDVCLWAYLIKNNRLSADYLTDFHLQESYIINSVAAQQLIARNLRSENGERFVFDNRKNVGYAQRWYGRFADEQDEARDLFFLFTNTRFDEALKKQEATAMKVFKDTERPMYERIGALYFLTPLNDQKMKTLVKYDDLPIRWCTCSEMRPYIANKFKKACEKDEREEIQKIVSTNKSFE
jgi:hypothetical protein